MNVLFFGDPGTGKTTIIKTGANDPRLSPGIILDFEAGRLAIASVTKPVMSVTSHKEDAKARNISSRKDRIKDYREYLESQVEEGKILYIRIDQASDIDDMFSVLDVPQNIFRCIYVDSLSEIAYLILREVTEQSGADNPGKHDGVLAQIQDYGRASVTIRRIVHDFRDLPIHTIFTSHRADIKDKSDMSIYTCPNLFGKLSKEVPGLFDIVGYVHFTGTVKKKDVKRIIQFVGDEYNLCKDRSEGGRLGESIHFTDNFPTLPYILDLLENNNNSTTSQITI